MYNLPEISESVEQLEQLVHEENNAQIQRRLRMLLLLKSGEAETRTAAARRLNVHRNTVANWLGSYEDGGIAELCEIGTPGPDPGQQSIPPEVAEALRDYLSGPEEFDSYKEIQRWLAEEHGVELPYSTVHGIVRYRMNATPSAPRSRPAKAEDEST